MIFDIDNSTKSLDVAADFYNQFHSIANTNRWSECKAEIEAEADRLSKEYEDEYLTDVLRVTIDELHRQSTFNSMVRAGKW
jgi:hypothetical protein